MRTLVLRATDLGNPSVGRNDQDGGHVGFQRPIQEGEALHIEHVHLIDEQDAGNDGGPSLLAPFGHLGIDLIPHLALDLAGISREQGQETLLPGIDDINLVQTYGVDDLLSLLQLPLWTLHEASLGPHGIVVSAAAEGTAELADLSAGLVNGDNVAGRHLLLGEGVDHLGPEVVHGLHLRRAEGETSALLEPTPRGALLGGSDGGIDLNFHHLALDDFGLLEYPNADGPAEGLRQHLRLGHFQAEHLRSAQGGEGGVLPELLGQPHGDGGLARAGLAGEEDGPAADLALPDHPVDDADGPAGGGLADHPLGAARAGFESIVQTESPNVRMRPDPLQPGELPDGDASACLSGTG
mmetsp:Transcript_6849/g.19132  ORF Transcript_6849/g.19132 Transcript_6849/m.19132 type:complete len:353 (+) Transcript_6849:536-1594(+)